MAFQLLAEFPPNTRNNTCSACLCSRRTNDRIIDPFISLDARLTKIIEVGATRRFEVFLEGYNLTNHENFQPFTINANINSASFLIRNSARPPRQIQWGARYSF